jgi:2-oxoglutarate ferredoxin oxidoreductase subunit gamma
MNSSLIDQTPELDKSIEIVCLPADKIAYELGSTKVANMVALGAYLQKRGLFGLEAAADCLSDVLAQRYHVTIPLNKNALQKGAQFIKENAG